MREASGLLETFHILMWASGSQLQAIFTPRAYSATSGDVLGCHHLSKRRGAADIQQVEVKDAAEHATRCRQPPTENYQNFLAHNGSGDKVEESRSGGWVLDGKV